MNNENLHELFQPLNKTEKESLKIGIVRLMDNPDFILLVRDIFNKANPLTPSFSIANKFDSHQAAREDGEKLVSKYLLNFFLMKNKEDTPKQTTQL